MAAHQKLRMAQDAAGVVVRSQAVVVVRVSARVVVDIAVVLVPYFLPDMALDIMLAELCLVGTLA